MTLNQIQNETHAIQEIFSILMSSGVHSNFFVIFHLIFLAYFVLLKVFLIVVYFINTLVMGKSV